jgi:hypothetical protein
MTAWSPTVEGFRTLFRRPALPLAEISWRWSFGAAAWLLGVFAFFEYLDTLPVSNRDLLFLRSGTPAFISRALAHIIRGSGLRLVLAILLVSAALSVVWILLASLGRAATLEPLLESIRARARSSAEIEAPDFSSVGARGISRHPVRSLAGLHFLRVVVFLGAAFALAGALFAARLLSPNDDPQPALAVLAFLSLAFLIFLAVTSLNWLLSLATLFVVRDAQDSFGAISSAMDLCRDRLGAVFTVGIWFGLAHLTFFVIATSVVGFPLALLHVVPPGFVLLAVVLVTLLYFAIADSLYIGRLAGYAAILEAPPVATSTVAPSEAFIPEPRFFTSKPEFTAMSPVPSVSEPASAVVDQSELILSDTAGELSTPSSPLGEAGNPPVPRSES